MVRMQAFMAQMCDHVPILPLEFVPEIGQVPRANTLQYTCLV